MLLEELIQRLDKNDQTKDNVYVEDLQDLLRYEFGIHMNLDDHKMNTRVTCYWLCYYHQDEYWNGFKVYFLDDRLLAVSNSYDKDEDFTFANPVIKQELKEYILSLAKVEEYNSKDYLDLKQEWGEGYKLNYAHHLLATHVMYNGQKCKVIYPKGQHADSTKYTKRYEDNFDFSSYKYGDPAPLEVIDIELPDDNTMSVELNKVQVCFNII